MRKSLVTNVFGNLTAFTWTYFLHLISPHLSVVGRWYGFREYPPFMMEDEVGQKSSSIVLMDGVM